jgi:type II secretory pathway component GspD/PulD (secretin)
MMDKRTRVMALGLGLALVVSITLALAVVAWGQQEEERITVELRDATLSSALSMVFKSTPYSYTLAPGLGNLTVTLTLNDVTFSQALRAILDMHNLTYRKEPGDMYYITQREAEIIVPGPTPQDEGVVTQQHYYWFGAGGRYELQYLDCRDVISWFGGSVVGGTPMIPMAIGGGGGGQDRKSTRLNSSH